MLLSPICRSSRSLLFIALLSFMTVAAQAQKGLVELSSDPFTNTTSQHATEVEPDSYAVGSTVVTAFQTGRIFSGGSSDIGFATSTDGGSTWTHGFLPGITTFYKNGPYAAASDAAVVYDAAHGKWLITSIALNSGATGVAVLSSSSTDALHWNNPVIVNDNSSFADKDWVTCDNTSSSPYYGHCYVEWEDAGIGDQVEMSTSTDGGQTWSAKSPIPGAIGLGGQPIVQTNGTAVVPFLSFSSGGIGVFTSTNGGKNWGSLGTISNVTSHSVAGNLRAIYELPSAAVDGAGTLYVAWWDCRFRSGCSSNDIVYSSSSNAKTWSSVTRVPIDPVTSTVDHFIEGLAVDPTTSGSSAHLAVTFYYYPVANCSQSTCNLSAGFISSSDAGTTWNKPTVLATGMNNNWLPSTDLGQMVGDYIGTSYTNGKAFGFFAGALPPRSGKFFEVMATNKVGLSEEGPGPLSAANDKPVPNAKSDHGPYQFWDSEGRLPRNPSEMPDRD
ncbi:MAG TPA: sialidase family protein [Terriglobales bacterium]|nr:sialidase family protein [Terriglobales bacterium]